MPRYKTPIDQLLTEDKVMKIYEQGNKTDKVLVSLCWKTAGRTHEISELKKEDVSIFDDNIKIKLHTEKLGKTNEFILRERLLEFARPKGVEMDIFVETIIRYVEDLSEGQPIMPYGDRWIQRRLNVLGAKALGMEISLYHFRHSAITREANKGHGIGDLMHFKGAKSSRSVEGYLHATPYKVG